MKKVVLKKIIAELNLLPLIEQVNFFREKWKNRKIEKVTKNLKGRIQM